MRKSILAISFVLASAALALGIQQEDWVRFTPPDARFSLLFPREPKLEVVSHPEYPQLTHNRYSDAEEGYAFIVEYFDNAVNSDPEEYLDEVRDGILRAVNGKLIKEDRIRLAENPGRDFEYSLTEHSGSVFLGRTRIYVVGLSLYRLTFMRQQELEQTRAARLGEKYFSSFKPKPVR
jgi:hypothetical protein